MEEEKIRKKNKRVIREDVVHEVEEEEDKDEKSDQKKLKVEQEAAVTGAGGNNSVVPTEEEVEECFAILRRMKVAVKYFDDKGKEGGKEWREALEQVDVTVDDGGDGVDGVFYNKKGGKVTINEGLDLNAVAPEAIESGGE